MKLKEIQKILKREGNLKVKESFEKSIPSAEKIYGVRVPILNSIAKEIEKPDFKLVKELWRSGSLEERLLAAKILGRIANEDREKTLKLVEGFSKDISNWAVCDTLATQGIRKIAGDKSEDIFRISEKYISSKNLWRKRFALILLIEISRAGFDKERIKKLAGKVKEEKEPYIQKAVSWFKKELRKRNVNYNSSD